jgi:sulfate permease, SulP family
LLSIFYLTNFELVAYIPKTAFSSLICLSFLDMVITWGYDSYFKTKEKMEWLVVPLIVVFAFVVGLLQAVFLGIALSTFIFVAAFFQTGVVKFMATGLTVRSTIERSAGSGNWLDDNGDKIQILVLQNYLFFGNASSLLAYISSMFDEPDDGDLISYSSLPPLPRYIILDMTLVSGMDTSTADVFLDIKTLCSQHNCKLFCAGISSRLRGVLALGNFKPESGDRSSREVRFFADLDAAIGKAEDCLLVDEFKDDFSTGSIDTMDPADAPGRLATILRNAENDWGFKSALQQIDDQVR